MSKVYVSVTTTVALISLNMPGETMRLSSDIVIVTRISLNNQDMRFLFFPLFYHKKKNNPINIVISLTKPYKANGLQIIQIENTYIHTLIGVLCTFFS
jgi:hypothetical protein